MRTPRRSRFLSRASLPPVVGLMLSLVLSLALTTLGPPGIAAAAAPDRSLPGSLGADEPSATVSGVVRDGSGQGWPLYAKITVSGASSGAVYTDPVTGRYRLGLPQGRTSTLHVVPLYSGYLAKDQDVVVPPQALAVTADIMVGIDVPACNTPGYIAHRTGATQTFDAATTPPGWSITGTEPGWKIVDTLPSDYPPPFSDPDSRLNNTGGSGRFAIAHSSIVDTGARMDTSLITQPTDLLGLGSPVVEFDTQFYPVFNSDQATADVDVSADGGATWTTLWHRTTESPRQGMHVGLLLPAAFAVNGVRVRFHLTSTGPNQWWEVDNVFIGNRTCDPVPGGLVVGQTTDANTGTALARVAVVAGTGKTATHATSAATPDDPALGDGFYWMFVQGLGDSPISATLVLYRTASSSVSVIAGSTVRRDLALPAGRVEVGPAKIDTTVARGGRAEATVTIRNTGTAPASVTLDERTGEPDPAPAPVNSATSSWTSMAPYPTGVQYSVAATHKGKVYAAFGYKGFYASSKSLYIYDPATRAWSQGADGPSTRERAVGAFVGDRLYVTSGFTSQMNGSLVSRTDIYDPGSNTWSTGAPIPAPLPDSAVTVLGGKMYVIGGCYGSCSNQVHVYDPATDSWSTAAAYPEQMSSPFCGTIAGRIYCAGGVNYTGSSVHTWAYDPATNTWSARADMPVALYASAYIAAKGLLLIASGLTGKPDTLTNRALAYNPATDTWTPLPDTPGMTFGSAGACGMYRIGGKYQLQETPGRPLPASSSVEMLPGFSECEESSDVPWLSTSAGNITVPPGQCVTVTVRVDASVSAITAPGRSIANLAVIADTPYPGRSVPVTMTVQPPSQ